MTVSFAVGNTICEPWPNDTTAFVKAPELVTQLSAASNSKCKIIIVHDSLAPQTILVIWPKHTNRKLRVYVKGEAKEDKFLYILP